MIGTDGAGTRAIPNGFDGVFLNNAPGNTIGGTAAGAGNQISGNNSVGIQLFGPLTVGNVIEGNSLGLDSAGRLTLPNRAGGIFVNTGPLTNQIGGTAPGQANRGQVRVRYSIAGFHQSNQAMRTKPDWPGPEVGPASSDDQIFTRESGSSADHGRRSEREGTPGRSTKRDVEHQCELAVERQGAGHRVGHRPPTVRPDWRGRS